jgi:hypothetical protein
VVSLSDIHFVITHFVIPNRRPLPVRNLLLAEQEQIPRAMENDNHLKLTHYLSHGI